MISTQIRHSKRYDYEVAARSFVPGYESIFNMAVALLDASVSEQAHLLIVAAGGGMELITFGQARWRTRPLEAIALALYRR